MVSKYTKPFWDIYGKRAMTEANTHPSDFDSNALEAAYRALGPLSANEDSYLAQVLQDVEEAELEGLGPKAFVGLLRDYWRDTETLNISTPHIAFKTLKGHSHTYDVLCLTQKDKPFVVESVMGELMDQACQVRAMFHPVINADRDAHGKRQASEQSKESMVLILIDALSPERQKALLDGINLTLTDLQLAVVDFPRMQKLISEEIATLKALQGKIKVDAGLMAENIAFLEWVDANHFVFLGAKGYIYPRDADGNYQAEAPLNQFQQGYGVLRDNNRPVLRNSSEPALLSRQLLHQIEHSEPVTIAKANLKSKVHRRVYMDYIGIKRYGDDGRPAGEVRFVGLFTAEAYDRPVMEVPLIRRKAARVLDEATRLGYSYGGYNEKRLKNILETYPRDELFQMSEDDLLRISRGILHISDRPRVRLFARHDPFDRFISILLFMPREAYSETVRTQAGIGLANAYGGRVSASYPNLTGGLLSSVHYIIGVTPGQHLHPDLTLIEDAIEKLSLSWSQKYLEAAAIDGAQAALDWTAWSKAFPLAYQERYDLNEALTDTGILAGLNDDEPVAVRAFQRLEDDQRFIGFKLYTKAKRAIALSDILPVLENMGLRTLEEYGNSVKSEALGQYWVHEFLLKRPDSVTVAFEDLKSAFEATLMAIRRQKTEDDGFNALVLLGLPWRDIALLRALCRYRAQSGLDPNSLVQQQALRNNPDVTNALLALFYARFAPNDLAHSAREAQVTKAAQQVEQGLQAVASLEEDRVLRRLYLLLMATLRSNFFQVAQDGSPKPYISFKIASRELKDLNEPKPYREIFVWAPHVEGVHLRFGPVARGGLRWSDRRDDFRTEVLGLVKAQQVKNAVIVPVGSKGGFFPKALPKGGTPDAVRQEAIRAYKTFLSGLLDLTDNIDAANAIVPPASVVCWDKPDPYLVVAADKGTATFSDIANGVARDYGFWLDDAFASGGSKGYDHKVMGITAKGAWEAVKRHFREKGKDIQSEAFTMVGVGDMSGDVFGNGLLLSQKTKLLAAFDHRDIFLDPNPDTGKSHAERVRMFNLPRSSWADYDKCLISKGGGVFSRSLKTITVSPEAAAALGIEAGDMAPTDLMQAILKAPAELLYFGGIGTYIKAAHQTHLDVGDKANDAIRIDAGDVRASVIGEGANLGLTQQGRIALAEQGVALNTDAIDNSAGVDCSDHEVNIKILLGALVAKGDMTPEARDALLADMTDDVSELVLKDNYDQTLALSLQQIDADADSIATQAFMKRLEQAGRLDRKVEDLPTNTVMEARRKSHLGLYRPELAVVMAYGKLSLFDDIIASNVPDDEGLNDRLKAYFPKALQGMDGAMKNHRLRREIIATILSNDIVNLAGPSFVARLRDSADVNTDTAVTAFEAARRLFNLDALWVRVHGLDNRVSAATQAKLYQKIAAFLRHQTYWLARKFTGQDTDLAAILKPYQASVATLLAAGQSPLTDKMKEKQVTRTKTLCDMGAPNDLAHAVALLGQWHQATDIIDLSQAFEKDLMKTAELYALSGEIFGFDQLCKGAGELSSPDPWDRMATRRLIEDVRHEQKAVVKAMMSTMTPQEQPTQIINNWKARHAERIEPLNRLMASFEAAANEGGQGLSFAKLTIVNARLREWVSRIA